MYDNDKREKSIEQTFLSRALIDNSKSRICYKDIREKYFGYEITAVKQAKIEAARREAERIEAAKLEAARLEAERIAALNNVEEGDMMKNNELEKFVVETPSSEPVVVELTEKEKAKLLEKERKALEKQKEKERLAKEKEKQKEKERLAREKEKQKEKERLAREKEKLKEKERLAKEKQKEKERLAKEKEKQRELEKKQRAEEKKRLAQEAAASAHTAKMTFETEEQPIKDVVQSVEIEDVVQEENEVQEEYIPVDSKPMTFEEMLAKKKKDDNKPTEIPSDNLARLRQRMEANRKLEQGIVEQDSKKAQAIEESKNKLKAMNNIAYEEETTDDLYQLIDDLEAKVQELEDLNKELTEQVESLESEIKQLTAEDSGNLAVVVDKLDKQLDDKNEELERKERLIEDLKAELNEAKDEIAELEANALDAKVVDKLQEQIDNLEEENEELQVNVDELTANEEELQAKIAELVQKIQDSQDVQKMESLEEENAKLKEEVQRLTDECSLYKEQIEVLQASEISKQEEIDNLNKDLEAYEKQAKEAIEKLALAEGVVVKESGFGVDVTIDELNEKIAFIKEQLADEKVLEENSEEEKGESLEQEANEEAEEVTLEQEASEEAEEVAVEQVASEEAEEVTLEQEASSEAEEVAVEQVASEEVQEECSDVAEEEPLEFNELISLIHTRKQEVIDKMLADKEEYQKDSLLNKDALEKALSEYTEVKSYHDELDDEYKNEIEAGALTEEEYLEKVQEIANEEEIIEIQISERKEEEKAYSDKFEETLDNSETEIVTLCRQELEAIEVYLNKLNEEYAEKEDKYQEYSEEKYALLKQLDDLNVSYLQLKLDICQSRAIILDNLKNSEEVLERIADEEYVENRREKIASQIALKNKEYDRLLNKINKIKEHQEKRIKSEKVLRITDEAIVRYNDVLTDFETFSLRYQTNDEVLGILKQELAGLNPEEDKEAIESLNSKIMNVEILQNDISDKINYFKEVKESLEEDDKVSYYIRLLKSMEQLKVKNIEFRVQANNVKSRINELNEELESLK